MKRKRGRYPVNLCPKHTFKNYIIVFWKNEESHIFEVYTEISSHHIRFFKDYKEVKYLINLPKDMPADKNMQPI